MDSYAGSMLKALELARNDIEKRFAGAPHFVDFCTSHITHILTGKGELPPGAPATPARGAIKEAVNMALSEAFGHDYRIKVDYVLLTRLATL